MPIVVPLSGMALGYGEFDRSRYRVAEDFGRKLLTSLPEGAHLSASGDNVLFPLMYLHWVEGLRPDIDLILQGVAEPERPPLRFDPRPALEVSSTNEAGTLWQVVTPDRTKKFP